MVGVAKRRGDKGTWSSMEPRVVRPGTSNDLRGAGTARCNYRPRWRVGLVGTGLVGMGNVEN